MVRLTALTMPWVMVRSNWPNGLPMTMAVCPTLRSADVPISSGCTSSGTESTTITARSLIGSVPTTVAGRPASPPKLTSMLCAPWTTWLLVTMCPSVSHRKPEPLPSSGVAPQKKFERNTWVVTLTTAGATRAYTAIRRASMLSALSSATGPGVGVATTVMTLGVDVGAGVDISNTGRPANVQAAITPAVSSNDRKSRMRFIVPVAAARPA